PQRAGGEREQQRLAQSARDRVELIHLLAREVALADPKQAVHPPLVMLRLELRMRRERRFDAVDLEPLVDMPGVEKGDLARDEHRAEQRGTTAAVDGLARELDRALGR